MHRMFLPKDLATGKQFRPRSLPVHQKQYPIIWFLADSHFHDVATKLNELMKFFNRNTIGLFMYDEELDFFIVSFRRVNSVRWSYLRYAVNYMYNKYYR